MTKERVIAELAAEYGFDLFGIAPLQPPRDADRFREWIASGRSAGLSYLERDSARILDPRQLLAGGRSILVFGMAHSRPAVTLSDGTRLARYAAGRDYHNLLIKRLRRLLRRLKRLGIVQKARTLADAGPLLERSHAAEAGVGFASKAANLLHPAFGPWFFLGEILVDAPLEPTPTPPPGACGSCRACLDACPTGAIVAPGTVDARRCISYHNIESPDRVPAAWRAQVSEWAFGCDVCSEVCPWAQKAPDLSARYGTHPIVEEGLLAWLQNREAFESRTEGSSLRRPGRAGLARNAALALSRRPSDQAREALLGALTEDPSAIVREAAAWSLARAYPEDRGVRRTLQGAAVADPDPQNRSLIEAWLEGRTDSTADASDVDPDRHPGKSQ